MKHLLPAVVAGVGRRWLARFSRLYLLVCLTALLVLLVGQGDLLATVRPRAPAWTGLAILLVALTHLFAVAFTRHVLATLGSPASAVLAADVHLRFLPTRYLPGGVWHTLGRLEQLRRAGLPLSRASLLPIAESIAAVSAALLIAAVLTLSAPPVGTWMLISALAIAGAGSLLPALEAARAPPALLAACAMLGFWVCQQLAFGCFLVSLELAGAEPAPATGHWALAWALGHLAVFAPQGIGVSEFVYAQLLDSGLAAALTVSAFRLVQALGDLLAWLAWLAWRRCATATQLREGGCGPDTPGTPPPTPRDPPAKSGIPISAADEPAGSH
jgi:hypothetical protein